MLTETWAEEMKESKVVVNCVHPGWVDTPLLRAAGPMEGFYKFVFRGREGEGGREGRAIAWRSGTCIYSWWGKREGTQHSENDFVSLTIITSLPPSLPLPQTPPLFLQAYAWKPPHGTPRRRHHRLARRLQEGGGAHGQVFLRPQGEVDQSLICKHKPGKEGLWRAGGLL